MPEMKLKFGAAIISVGMNIRKQSRFTENSVAFQPWPLRKISYTNQ